MRSVSLAVIASSVRSTTLPVSVLEYLIASFTENTPITIADTSHRPKRLSFALTGIDFRLEETILSPK